MGQYRYMVFSWCVFSALFLSGTIARAQWAPGAQAGAESRVYFQLDTFLDEIADENVRKCCRDALFASGILVKSSGVHLRSHMFYACNYARARLANDRNDHYEEDYIYPIARVSADMVYTINNNILSVYMMLRFYNCESSVYLDPVEKYVYAYSPNSSTSVPVDIVEKMCFCPVIVFSYQDYNLPTRKDIILGKALGLPVRTSGAVNEMTVTILSDDLMNLTGSEVGMPRLYQNAVSNEPGFRLTWEELEQTPGYTSGVTTWSTINPRFQTYPTSAPWNDTDTDEGGMQDYKEWSLNGHNWWGNPADDEDNLYYEPELDEPPELPPAQGAVDIGEVTGEYLEWLVGRADPQGGEGAPLPAMPVPATLEGEFEAPTPDSFEAPPIDVNQDKADLEAQFRQEFAQNGWTTAINAFTDPQFNSMTLPDEVFNPVIAVGSFANGDQASSLDLGNHIVSVTGELSEFAGQDKLNIIRLALKAVLIIGTGWALIRLLMSTVNGAKTDD